jgi:hypothetical protein
VGERRGRGGVWGDEGWGLRVEEPKVHCA